MSFIFKEISSILSYLVFLKYSNNSFSDILNAESKSLNNGNVLWAMFVNFFKKIKNFWENIIYF